MIERRFDVVTAEHLALIADQPLPGGIASSALRVLHRDLYFDTDDDHLQRRGIACRLRISSDDRRVLTVFVGTVDDPSPPTRYDAEIASADARVALSGDTPPARRLSAVVDVRLLEMKLELQVERVVRVADRDWRGRPRLDVVYDRIHVRRGVASRAFHQITVRTRGTSSRRFEQVCGDLERNAGLRSIAAGTRERAQLLLKWMEREERGAGNQTESVVSLVLTCNGELALFARDDLLSIPVERGAGVGVARTLVDRFTRGRGSDARLLGRVSAVGPLPPIEVWAADVFDGAHVATELGNTVWTTTASALRHAADMDPNTVAAIAVVTRGGLLDHQSPALAPAGLSASRHSGARSIVKHAELPTGEPHLLNSETSILAFTARVLALAEDIRVPLGERLRFVAIVSTNLDEFFMVRVAGIKRSVQELADERRADGLTAREQLDLIASHARALVARLYRCYEACAAEAEVRGGRIVTWNHLDVGQKDELRQIMRKELLPGLTPLAMTLSPGHPFPRLRHLSLSLAVVVLDRPGATPHFAQVELPDDSPRLIPVPRLDAVIPIEELVRANIDLLYPTAVVEQAYAFRVTRGTDLDLTAGQPAGLLQAVEDAARRRFDQPVVRVEVERAMPSVLRDIVVREIRLEQGGAGLESNDVYEVEGLLDLGCVGGLPLHADPQLFFPEFHGGDPWVNEVDLWSAIDRRDRLCHHPFDDYDATVARFFRDAAADPAVTAIKLTVYRADPRSAIMAALLAAAERGKDVVVFVELKARFDEERNVGWAKQLEAAGGRIVHGFVGLKNHAKIALIVRRDGGFLRRYVHAGTGNYNAETAKRYTDLSLFTSNDAITADVQDLFNELTGRSRAPERLARGCLISPKQLLPELVARIEREAAHARAGRTGLIRIKVNGLSEPAIIDALVRASVDGVRIELIVRGVCTLRPGVPGISAGIRVLSVLGRFLEHSRMAYFANGGEPEYFIGSADLRPRNLRRRVELFVPVNDPACRSQLDAIWASYAADQQAWELGEDGQYVRRRGSLGAQDTLLAGAG